MTPSEIALELTKLYVQYMQSRPNHGTLSMKDIKSAFLEFRTAAKPESTKKQQPQQTSQKSAGKH